MGSECTTKPRENGGRGNCDQSLASGLGYTCNAASGSLAGGTTDWAMGEMAYVARRRLVC